MFIYSMRASTIKFFGIVCVALAALVALIAFVPAYASGNSGTVNNGATGGVQVGVSEENTAEAVSIKYEKVRSADDAAGFLSQFGWVVDAGSAETVPNCASSVVITETFLSGGITFGSCVAGLCVNAGMGFVVLLRNVRQWKRNFALIGFCYLLSVAIGLLFNLVYPISVSIV